MTMTFACLLTSRGIVRIGGLSRADFLQGLISNDIRLAKDGRAIHAALLTPQGKFLHEFFIAAHNDEYLIDCEAARAEDLLKRLTAYQLRARVTLANATDDYDVWAVWGANLPPRPNSILFTDPRLSALGQRLIVKKGTTPEGIKPADFSAYDDHRLALGVADGSRDMVLEKSTLSEGNVDLLNGISWTKGCYIGQELTARMHYRALVKKRLFPVTFKGATPPSGSPVKLGGEDIGEMRSATDSRGLALLNVEKAERAIGEKLALDCAGTKLMPSKPAWMTGAN